MKLRHLRYILVISILRPLFIDSYQVAVMNGSAEQQLAILQNAEVHGKYLKAVYISKGVSWQFEHPE